jgi:hypothetical protein
MDAINSVINELMDAINRCLNSVNISECDPPHGRSDEKHSGTRIYHVEPNGIVLHVM